MRKGPGVRGRGPGKEGTVCLGLYSFALRIVWSVESGVWSFIATNEDRRSGPTTLNKVWSWGYAEGEFNKIIRALLKPIKGWRMTLFIFLKSGI